MIGMTSNLYNLNGQKYEKFGSWQKVAKVLFSLRILLSFRAPYFSEFFHILHNQPNYKQLE